MTQRCKRPDRTVAHSYHGPIVKVSIDKLDNWVKLLRRRFYLLLLVLPSGAMQQKFFFFFLLHHKPLYILRNMSRPFSLWVLVLCMGALELQCFLRIFSTMSFFTLIPYNHWVYHHWLIFWGIRTVLLSYLDELISPLPELIIKYVFRSTLQPMVPIFLLFHFSSNSQKHWRRQCEDAGHANPYKGYWDADFCLDCHGCHSPAHCSGSWRCGVVPASSEEVTAQQEVHPGWQLQASVSQAVTAGSWNCTSGIYSQQAMD